MYIEHIAMYVSDLEKIKEFFIKYLGAKSNNIYHKKYNVCISCVFFFFLDYIWFVNITPDRYFVTMCV